ncbi:sensor histidine kinase [Cucumibacter marinus]|uniref:sensor histidine kinase n=1 Tax=Cucumibacter marinus TaxID=1121252 RepID=UPI00048F77DE|nr:HAMP domain-containing sensor histidine kinase [Cucumibacter marinus]
MNSEAAGEVSAFALDPRPAWLWSGDGETLIWRNAAAWLYRAKEKDGALKPAALPVPIKGQVARLVRIGVNGRGSLSRLRFLAGSKPLAATCLCIPQVLDGQRVLLIIDTQELDADPESFRQALALPQFEDSPAQAVTDRHGEVIALSDAARALLSEPYGGVNRATIEADSGVGSTALPAGPDGETLMVIWRRETDATPAPNVEDPAYGMTPPSAAADQPPATPDDTETPENETPKTETAKLAPPVSGDAEVEKTAVEGQEIPIDETPVEVVAEPVTAAPETVDDPANENRDDTEAGATEHDGAPADFAESEQPVEQAPIEEAGPGPQVLTGLIDRLGGSDALFAPLDEDSEDFGPPVPLNPPAPSAPDSGGRALFSLDRHGRPHGTSGGPYRFSASDTIDAVLEMIDPLDQDLAEAAMAGVSLQPLSVTLADGRPVRMVPLFERLGGFDGWHVYSEPDRREAEPREPVENGGSYDAEIEKYSPEASEDAQTEADAGAAEADDAPEDAAPREETPADNAAGEEPAGDTGPIDEKSRYNFTELSRLLNDRIGGGETEPPVTERNSASEPETGGADLVPLSDETLVLNRLPLGLLVFRDQALLFANRAMAELTGYGSSTALREAGFDTLFPEVSDDDDAVGPVTHLTHRNGHKVAVVARLQTIAWQGRPAYLLSARAADAAPVEEEDEGGMTTRATVELIAAQSNCGFIQLTSEGRIAGISDLGAQIIGPARSVLLGRPLFDYLDEKGRQKLAGFLAGHFAGEDTLTITAEAGAGPADVSLFVDRGDRRKNLRHHGYLGLVRISPAREAAAAGSAVVPTHDDMAPLLAHLSHELRGPLNTILGFSELIASQELGNFTIDRLNEYGRDIHRAGREIQAMIDEIADLSRFEGGTFTLEETEIELNALLESCARRIRPRANARRIVLRSAVSQTLPVIRADKTLLDQTVMNMLASAVAISTDGGNVVLSAQSEATGGVLIHIRDHGRPSGSRSAEEGFVVYKDSDGEGLDGGVPRSHMGLAVTRSMARANALTLSIDRQDDAGTLMSLIVPANKVIRRLSQG